MNSEDKTTMELNELARELYAAKRTEDAAKKQRIQIEERIAALVETPERGSRTVDAGEGMKINVKRDLSYEGDVQALCKALGDLAPVEIIPEELAFSPKKYEALRESNPAAFEAATRHVSTRPRKVSVSLRLA